MIDKLKFQKVDNNAKLAYMGKGAYTFSLISGWSCPSAKDCLSKVYREDGKSHLEDGPDTKFRCFSASNEALYPIVYNARKYNFDLLRKRSEAEIYDLIRMSLPKDLNILRLHVAGDFFRESYFKAWVKIAIDFNDKIFYAYTKSLDYWVKNIDSIPDNFRLTASRGGKHDNLIDEYNLKCAEVVFSEEEARDKGLEIDHDDRLAYEGTNNFALLIHGSQAKGSEAAKAWQKVKKARGGYSKKNNLRKELVRTLVE